MISSLLDDNPASDIITADAGRDRCSVVLLAVARFERVVAVLVDRALALLE
jgi:hypothetical protein